MLVIDLKIDSGMKRTQDVSCYGQRRIVCVPLAIEEFFKDESATFLKQDTQASLQAF